MSFGFGVGDFVSVIRLANDLRQAFAGAPNQYRELSQEVRALAVILQDLDDSLENHDGDLTDPLKRDGDECLASCHETLSSLRSFLEANSEVDSSRAGFRAKPKRTWKRLRWRPAEVDQLRDRLIVVVGVANALNERITRCSMKLVANSVSKLNERQDMQEVQKQHDDSKRERQRILDWLSTSQHASQHTDIFGRQQQGTGKWLLESTEFQAWSSNADSVLFCPGIPGAGKTMLASIVIEHLVSSFGHDDDVAIVYIYCNYKMQQEQGIEQLLASLLQQLLQTRPAVPKNVQDLFVHHENKGTRPSSDELFALIQSTAAEYSRVFVIIDALDECRNTDLTRKRLLDKIFGLVSPGLVQLFATSRNDPTIEEKFDGRRKLEIRATEEDITVYLKNHTEILPRFVLRKPGLQERIVTGITQAIDGMFLLARLHLESLKDMQTVKDIMGALKRLERDGSASKFAYDDALKLAYDEAFARIDNQGARPRALATQVLSWISYAKRPLTIYELQEALGVEVGNPVLDEDNFPDLENMVSVCAGLVTVDLESDTIRLVHYTTQEYLEQVRQDRDPKALIRIAESCISYLVLDIFASGCYYGKEFETRLLDCKFLFYAAKFWWEHAQHVDQESLTSLALEFLLDQSKVASCVQVLHAPQDRPMRLFSQTVPSQWTGFHLASYLGAARLVLSWPESKGLGGLKDSEGCTPLSRAARAGQEAVVRVLLERDDVDPNSRDNFGQTPLSWAAEKGHKAVVQILLEQGVDADLKDIMGRTPLSWAAEEGHKAIVQVLLERDDVEADSKDEHGRTPQSIAALRGHEAIVQVLLERDDVEADSKDEHGRTPLSIAALRGHEAIVQVLLERDDVEADSKDEHGRTPLSRAARVGHETIVQVLLERDDVDANSRDNFGQTPLSWAAEEGHKAVVQILLEQGVDADSKDIMGRTPLSWAAEEGCKAVVQILLEQGVEADSKDNYGQTPLSRAARAGQEAVVRVLLERDDVDPNSRDNFGQTPLSWAAEKGHKAVVQILLEQGVDADSKDIMGRTPLSWAAEEGHKAVVQTLLEQGVEADLKDEKGRTPLYWATALGHKAVVELLKEAGV